MRCLAASARTARVVVATCSPSALRSGPMTAAWITWVAARLPPVVSTASPTSTGPCRIASSSMMTPPLRLMALATPVLMDSVEVRKPRHVHEREERVAEFFADAPCVARRQRLGGLSYFLLHLEPRRPRVGPVEIHARGLALNSLRSQQ